MLNNEYYLWGAGTYGARTIEFMRDVLTFKAVIDKDQRKQGTLFNGVPVINDEEAMVDVPGVKIVIALNVPTEVREILLSKGFIENCDFFTLHDFIPRYFWNKNRTLVVKSVDFAATTMCNMKCKSCQTQIPIAANRRHISAESIISDLDMLFKHVDSVMTLNICCGESFLNKELPEICSRINERYSGRYNSLLVQANGTIIPNDDDLLCYAESKTTLVTSNYPENADFTEKLIEKFKEFGIKWYINRSGNREYWYDLGDPRVINETDAETLRERYKRCWQPGMGLYNGWLYICASQLWSHVVAEAGTLEAGDAFDLRRPKSESLKDALFTVISRQPPELGYISHCMRCNGVMKPFTQ